MDCSIFSEISLGEWGEGLMANLHGKRYPLSATFEITTRCNLSCVHCFINQPAACHAALERELSLTEVKRILDQMAEAGVLNLLLTGGEVLLRKDFKEIYLHAKRSGMLVMVFSNGTLLTRSMADFFAEWPPYFLELTVYGHSQPTYEGVTGVPGSYARFRRGLELALERKLNLGLKTIVLSVNKHEFPQIKDYADTLGLPFRYDAMLWPRLEGSMQPYEFGLSNQEIIALDEEDLNRQKKWLQLDGKISAGYDRSEYVYRCGAGFYAFHVDASGKMSMCMMARQPSYDIRAGSVEEGWRFLETVRAEKRKMDTPCRTCTAGILCSQCPGWSQLIHGNNEEVVEFICELSHSRMAYLDSLKLSDPQEEDHEAKEKV